MSLRRGGYLFLEFRTTRDRRATTSFRTNKRTFLDADEVARQIEEAGGRVVHRDTGLGLATFQDEDPHVCRMVAAWNESPDRPRT